MRKEKMPKTFKVKNDIYKQPIEHKLKININDAYSMLHNIVSSV